jgi:hypothetical protein
MIARRNLQIIAAVLLVGSIFLNIWGFHRSVSAGPSRNSDELVVAEEEYQHIRQRLLDLHYYNGFVSYVTNRDLNQTPFTDDDFKRWYQAQYTLVPWILLHDGAAVSGPKVNVKTTYVIGDFWDGPPLNVPSDLENVSDSGHLILFRRTARQ